MKKVLLAITTLVVMGTAHAQTTQLQTGVPPALEVQRLAPQLVLFAGGDVNFTNLVNGLAFGVPVTLTTPLQTGLTEIVTFTPAGAMTPLAIAQMLESARQTLISRGVAVPTAQQLAIVLAGGTLTTATGTTQVTPLITTPATLNTAATNSSPSLLGSGTTLRNTSDSPLSRGISDTPATFANSQAAPPAPLATPAPATTAPLGAATPTNTLTTATPPASGAIGGTRLLGAR
ncbi:MAG TPA: hypothetical protein VFK84_19905 [Burkholderiales bacterium]|nr:hypothetical protein [Burkholderiales bacterium]